MPFCEQQYIQRSCYISLFKFKSFDQLDAPQTSLNFRHLLSCGTIESQRFDPERNYGVFCPPVPSPKVLTQKAKNARTMKLSRLIVYYTVIVKQQLKFLNSHCSIVHSHCSIVCLIKKWVKNCRNFKFFEGKRNSQS